jgi:hypothetical protein
VPNAYGDDQRAVNGGEDGRKRREGSITEEKRAKSLFSLCEVETIEVVSCIPRARGGTHAKRRFRG